MNNERLAIRDLVSIGIFGVIIFVVTMIVSIILGSTAVGYLFMAAGVGLLSAPIYFLAVMRSGKHFVSFLIWTLNGLIWGLMGGVTVFAGMAIFGLIGELILWRDGYKNLLKISISYCLGILGYHIGSFFLLYVATDKFISTAMGSVASPGMDFAYTLIDAAKGWMGAVAVAAIIAASILSCLFASRILRKHFRKAGIV